MGKKGKGNKLAKMSEEERARYLQQRADIEEETRRRKIQLISLYMKNKLKREEAFGRLNMAKINQEWRSILRRVKCDELQQEIIDLDKFSKESLERKDQSIQRLMHDLQVAEDIYATNKEAHMEIIDRLISTHKNRLSFMREVYLKNKREILSDHGIDSLEFKQKSDKSREQLECVIFQLEEEKERELNSRYERHLQELDDIKSTRQLELEEISRKGETKLENLWQQYQDVLSDYVKRTESFYTEYMDLKQNNENDQSIVRDYNYEIEKSSKLLSHLKLVSSDLEEKSETNLQRLHTIKNELLEKQMKFKTEVSKQTAAEEEKIKLLSVLSHKAVKHLIDMKKKGETLLQLCEACNKLMTEREKFFPLRFGFGFNSIKEDPPTGTYKLDDTFAHCLKLEHLWKRVNNAIVDVECLKQEKKQLEVENRRLKLKIQDSLVEINIQNGSNAHVNSYLKQRPQTMCISQAHREQNQKQEQESLVKRNGSEQKRPVTSIIEANFTNVGRSLNVAKRKIR